MAEKVIIKSGVRRKQRVVHPRGGRMRGVQRVHTPSQQDLCDPRGARTWRLAKGGSQAGMKPKP